MGEATRPTAAERRGQALHQADARARGLGTQHELAALAVYGVVYILRGVCAGLGWFSGYGLLLVTDGAARIAVVVSTPGGRAR